MYHFNNNFTGDTIMKIISIWILYILAWVINLTTSQFLDTLQIIKELIAILKSPEKLKIIVKNETNRIIPLLIFISLNKLVTDSKSDKFEKALYFYVLFFPFPVF